LKLTATTPTVQEKVLLQIAAKSSMAEDYAKLFVACS
jgi:hypothetical protein